MPDKPVRKVSTPEEKVENKLQARIAAVGRAITTLKRLDAGFDETTETEMAKETGEAISRLRIVRGLLIMVRVGASPPESTVESDS